MKKEKEKKEKLLRYRIVLIQLLGIHVGSVHGMVYGIFVNIFMHFHNY